MEQQIRTVAVLYQYSVLRYWPSYTSIEYCGIEPWQSYTSTVYCGIRHNFCKELT